MSDQLIRSAYPGGNGEGPPLEFDDRPMTKDIAVDVKWKAQHITTLHLKEPTARQQWLAEKELSVADMRQEPPWRIRAFMIVLVSSVANVPREVVEELPVHIVEDAFDFLVGLRGGGPRTGET